MITSNEALEIILNNTQNFDIEEIPFIESFERILKEDIKADRDFPPFDRVSMDGIAINYTAFTEGIRAFPIENIQSAGSKQLILKNNKNCIEVMTGAVLPKNTDVVIRYEDVTIENGIAKIIINAINNGQNIHRKGKDRKQEDILIKKNIKISAAEIGILATVGKETVKVAKQPKVMIISTGDELVEVDQLPLEYQIRRSNVYTLISLLKNLEINADNDHIIDNKEELKAKIKRYLKEYDVLLFSGAVSKGKFDFIPEVLDELGVKKSFHKVKQRPGKPFWFGSVKDALGISDQDGKKSRNTIVFAFPGNPVSTFMNCLKYFYPWYYKSVGLNYQLPTAKLVKDVIFKPEFTYFLQVKLENKNGLLIATPIKGNGSGDLANLADADGFLELPADKSEFKAGEVYPLIMYRN